MFWYCWVWPKLLRYLFHFYTLASQAGIWSGKNSLSSGELWRLHLDCSAGFEPLTTGSSGNLTSFFFFLSWFDIEPELILRKLRAKNWLATFLGLLLGLGFGPRPGLGLKNRPSSSSSLESKGYLKLIRNLSRPILVDWELDTEPIVTKAHSYYKMMLMAPRSIASSTALTVGLSRMDFFPPYI